ncbi:uncharacterized protein KIAA1614 isoform X2 [Megalops cyprinoides]|uniref:uncharacterized protein KIAA1614 isoform X2 n=1 Tax=Megalops cyprinoides TaxID=118141 RepID=UPI001863A10B|nr:uncharacterized protein KIAA1614 isoform X2 [Megalops cyprinoides]
MEEVAVAEGSDPLPDVLERAELQLGRRPETTLHVTDEQQLRSPSPDPSLELSTPSSCSPGSPCAGGQPQQHCLPGSAVSALQSKVKALSERRAAGRERDDRGPAGQVPTQSPVVLVRGSGQATVIKRVSASVLASAVTAKWQSSSSDEEMEPHVQVHSYLSNHPLSGEQEVQVEVLGGDGCELGPITGLAALSRELGEGASLENLSDCSTILQEEPPSKPWVPPKSFWKATRPETLPLNGDAPVAGDRMASGMMLATGIPKRAWLAGGQGVRRELQRSDSLESHLRRCVQSETGLVAPLGGLWRADSWESVCSSGSSLSLAERVEMNRGILKQMLSKPKGKDPEGPPGLGSEQQDTPECNGRGLTSLNDSDWDSGISLQDSEHSQRAFVFSEDLPLSPRHEQAKRLLERARMKARSYPLKADHTILPVQRDNPEVLSRAAAAPLRKAPLAGKEGAAAASGNLSDSSSGDSVCGPRRRHGQSPTRVRFEDESEKDAEVRYLERLRQRRRAGERTQGVLVSKPSLSAYVNGKKEGETGAAGTVGEAGRAPDGAPQWSKKTRRTQECSVANGGSHKATGQEAVSRKCNSCGTFLEGGNAPHLNSNANCQAPQTASADWESQGKLIPCWVTPAHPSRTVRTERIKETYIGEVVPAEDLDSSVAHCGLAGETENSSSGERASTLGKLKRKSRKGDGRQEVGLSPYARTVAGSGYHGVSSLQETSHCRPEPNGAELGSSQGGEVLPPNPYATEQSGHRPTSPPRDGTPAPPLVEPSSHRQIKDAPPGSSNPLPKKSALKSGSKNRPSGQRVVKLMPSPQYRLIHLDTLEDPCILEPSGGALEPPGDSDALRQCLEEQLCAVLSYNEDSPSLMKPCPPGLSTGICPAPCIRPSSLKYSAARAVDHAAGDPWDAASTEPAVGQYHQVNGELCHDPVSACSVPAPRCVGDGRIRGPLRAEHLREDSPEPGHGPESHKRVVFEGIDQREGRPKLSLRRFFSAIGLNSVGKQTQGRSSSMEQLSFSPKHGSASPSPTHRHCGQLKKAPSLQSLRMGSPFAQLRKASSVQSLQVPKRKGDRSSAYMPGEQPCSPAQSRGLQRALSVEDVSSPSAVRSVGRVAQAFPDGTLLLELRRPPNGPFGFLISRGKGRPDSGVYVEEMGDRSTQKLYAGLLGIGDEILEVNGEKVAGLTLDQVTRLMTQDCTASIRVLRHRRALR